MPGSTPNQPGWLLLCNNLVLSGVQLVVRKWSPQLSRDCLAHWLDLMTAQGWMAREQACPPLQLAWWGGPYSRPDQELVDNRPGWVPLAHGHAWQLASQCGTLQRDGSVCRW